jgi:hypothetical protein
MSADSATVSCIRCDTDLEVSSQLIDREYIALAYKHETKALPLCRSCLEDVDDRQLW